jgi:hypothetical protein
VLAPEHQFFNNEQPEMEMEMEMEMGGVLFRTNCRFPSEELIWSQFATITYFIALAL